MAVRGCVNRLWAPCYFDNELPMEAAAIGSPGLLLELKMASSSPAAAAAAAAMVGAAYMMCGNAWGVMAIDNMARHA